MDGRAPRSGARAKEWRLAPRSGAERVARGKSAQPLDDKRA
jgi:hypothetical protein